MNTQSPIKAVMDSGKYVIEFLDDKTNPNYYTFRVKDDPEATAVLLAMCKRKRVKKKDLRYAVIGLTEKLQDLDSNKNQTPNPNNIMNKNPIVLLAELAQKKWHANIETEVIDMWGEDHCPLIEVRVTLPNGAYEEAVANNQKEARKKASLSLLEKYFPNYVD